MIAKTLTLTFAAAALASAVIYAQNKAAKEKKPRPVFDTSKSGTPTPIDEPAVKIPAQSGEGGKPGKKPKTEGDMTIMPSSKSMMPPPKKPEQPTKPIPPT